VIGSAAKYALNRRQFGVPIATFGAIRHKLAEMTARAYGVESMLYRTAGLIDGFVARGQSALAALEEFAMEASLLKVASSEMTDFVLDENVQIHGGNGFVRDYPAERAYRDARVNRIFEGTNEINRLLVPGMLIKRALKGGVPLVAAAKRLQDELLAPPAGSAAAGTAPADLLAGTVAGMKKTAVMVLGLAMQTYGTALEQQQEVLMLASDIMMETFMAESALLRASQAGTADAAGAPLHADAAAVLTHDAGLRVDGCARIAIQAMTSGDTQRTALAALRRVLKITPVDTVAARRRLADAVTERKRYPFS
jgi:hypothetical protein